ncbi:DUF4309 domain-containing protein [Aureibacillus halotolerans]|uniref:Uncharacterized protein DUF4309 n=1 Tax=Aureibacillus halotolerans TaxID=1508390 RepID=A0A4R6U440_9BACI|nr:DUF4309 domain-containing protein [Aureibacillus halotolerans]TDQ40851.1 uncharacterized protein DUF4309 [Aureibacillus halotolerans]
MLNHHDKRLRQLTASIVTGSLLLGTAACSSNASATDASTHRSETQIEAHQTAPTQNEDSSNNLLDEKKVRQTLDDIVQKSKHRTLPGLPDKLIIEESKRDTVHEMLGAPYKEASVNHGYDLYSATMGHSGYAIHYSPEGVVDEIRFLGRNVERQQGIGGVTSAMVQESLGAPTTANVLSTTDQMAWTYSFDQTEVQFVFEAEEKTFSDETTLDHVNVLPADHTRAHAEAAKTLDSLIAAAKNGTAPGLPQPLTVGETTKDNVYNSLGKPVQSEHGYDSYSATMGHSGYALHYSEEDILQEIRFVGRNVERDQGIGGITASMIQAKLGQPTKTYTISSTGEQVLTYKLSSYTVKFVMDSAYPEDKNAPVSHVNVLAAQ